MIDLFRPYAAPEVLAALKSLGIEPSPEGRLYIGEGQKVVEFERELATLLEVDDPRRVVTVNSCTSAIDLALELSGVGPGDTVISTSMTCSATNSPPAKRGARIAWADVDPETGLIDPADACAVGERVTDHGDFPAKAIIAVDWGGASCDYNELRGYAQYLGGGQDDPAWRPSIIQDAAHSLLGTFNGRYFSKVGGDYQCYSLQAIKHLTSVDGGVLVCPDVVTAARARLLRWYGLDRTRGDSFRCSQDIAEVGFKYHMSDVTAAIGLKNLPHVRDVVWRHRRNAAALLSLLAGVEGVGLPRQDAGSSWWLFTVRISGGREERDAFIAYLGARGVAASPVHTPNHRHAAFRAITHPASGDLPGTEAFADAEAAIPCGWWLGGDDLMRVADAVKAWAESRQRVAA